MQIRTGMIRLGMDEVACPATIHIKQLLVNHLSRQGEHDDEKSLNDYWLYEEKVF